jgi:hypothetical protein
MGKLCRFPGRWARQKRVDINQHIARCQVSQRWLQFPGAGSRFSEGTFLAVDVMTLGGDEKPRKLCEMVLLKEELESILTAIQVGEGNDLP